MPTLATNSRASHDYEFLEKLEGGLVLTGAEAKAAKLGHINLKGAFLHVRGGELVIVNMHIGPYPYAGTDAHYNPTRERKVLAHRKEINRIAGKVMTERLTLVPISVYTAKNLVKLGFALARGKRQFEKRDSIKKRELDRDIRRKMSGDE